MKKFETPMNMQMVCGFEINPPNKGYSDETVLKCSDGGDGGDGDSGGL